MAPRAFRRPVQAWGRLKQLDCEVLPLQEPQQVPVAMGASGRPGLAYGMGRSYGDACLNGAGPLWLTTGLNRFISFDEDSGVLRCESGVLLEDIQRVFLPRGWVLPVTPGTQMITVGGAIANDVHGKSHHRHGSFGVHVLSLELARSDGRVLHCSRDTQAPLFAATIGGLGLTGVIVAAELQMQRGGPWLETETLAFPDIDGFLAIAGDSHAHWEHTAAWVDCVGRSAGRGLFMRGRPGSAAADRAAPVSGRRLRVPFSPPLSLVNGLSLRLFNAAYYYRGSRDAGLRLQYLEPFLYPLDNILEWNRLYGPRGFYQYQCVLPWDGGRDAMQEILAAIRRSGEGSFLAVLKTFGDVESPGMLSFPMPGLTLALDFPNRRERTLRLFERLDAIVREARGRLYAAKDARMPAELFAAGYPRLPEFLEHRDPGISSDLSRRLLGS